MVRENKRSTKQDAKQIQDAAKWILGKIVTVEFYVRFDSSHLIFDGVMLID